MSIFERLREARTLLKRKRPAEARALLDKILEEEPGNERAKTLLDRSLKQGIRPEEIDGWMENAAKSLEKGNESRARSLAERILAVDPNHQQALDLVWGLLEKEGDGVSPLSPVERQLAVSEILRNEVLLLLRENRVEDARWRIDEADLSKDVPVLLEIEAALVQSERLQASTARPEDADRQQDPEILGASLETSVRKPELEPVKVRTQAAELEALYSKFRRPQKSRNEPKGTENRQQNQQPPKSTFLPENQFPPEITQEGERRKPEPTPGTSIASGALTPGPLTASPSAPESHSSAPSDSPGGAPGSGPESAEGERLRSLKSEEEHRASDRTAPMRSPSYPGKVPQQMAPKAAPTPFRPASARSSREPATVQNLERSAPPSSARFPSSAAAVDPSLVETAQSTKPGSRKWLVGLLISALLAGAFLLWLRSPPGPPKLKRVRIAVPPEIQLGCAETSTAAGCDEDEAPITGLQDLQAFEIAATETTWRDYRKCVHAGHCAPPSWKEPPKAPGYPVTHVNWENAQRFCNWVRGRLPSELEWEIAALAAQPVQPPAQIEGKANVGDRNCCKKDGSDGWEGPGLVLEVGRTPLGLYGMIGNVAEWTNSRYEEKLSIQADKFAGASSQDLVTVRGGSWLQPPEMARPSFRQALAPNLGVGTIGFRCAWPLNY